MKKTIAIMIAIYLVLSCAISLAYNLDSENAWDIACNRNGLLVLSIEDNSVCVLSPFCNYGDVFLFGVAWQETEAGFEWWTFSDGLYEFGQWNI